MSLLLFPCLSMFVPLGAVLAGLLFKGKGYPRSATWAWWAAALLMISPFAILLAGALAALTSSEGPVFAGVLLSLVLQFSGNVCGGLAAEPDGARPAGAYVLLLTAFVLPSFFAYHRLWQYGTPEIPVVDAYLVPAYVLVGIPLGVLWFSGGGVAMALGRALVAPRRFEEDAPAG